MTGKVERVERSAGKGVPAGNPGTGLTSSYLNRVGFFWVTVIFTTYFPSALAACDCTFTGACVLTSKPKGLIGLATLGRLHTLRISACVGTPANATGSMVLVLTGAPPKAPWHSPSAMIAAPPASSGFARELNELISDLLVSRNCNPRQHPTPPSHPRPC